MLAQSRPPAGARLVGAKGARVVVNGGNCRWGDVNWVHYVHAAWSLCAAGGIPRRLKAFAAHRSYLAAERQAWRKPGSSWPTRSEPAPT